MNYGAILAGGIGSRMKRIDLPKQFLMLGSKPIIIHTLEQFFICKKIDKIIVATPMEWIEYTKDIIEKYMGDTDSIEITCGGADRNESIINICRFIDEKYGMEEDDILVTHDAVRPFVTQRIILNNIAAMKQHDVVDTVIEAVDTIVESKNGKTITSIPLRANMYQGQTPQTFKLKEFVAIYDELTEDEKHALTDAAKAFVIKDKKVHLVKGERFNIKITTSYDLELATHLLNIGEAK